MTTNLIPTATVGRWLLLWTAIGCVFALQLRWYHALPWSISVFWGLADWHLWGLLALLAGFAIRQLKQLRIGIAKRIGVYALVSPLVVALHVFLTMLVGEVAGFPLNTQWFEYFQALFAKKLSLNLLTYAAIVVVWERLSIDNVQEDELLIGRRGDVTRLISAGEIAHGEVCGNYVNLCTNDGMWPVRVTLTQLLDRLPSGKFLRISRSALVSLNRVDKLRSDGDALYLSLVDGIQLPVSRRYRRRVRQAILEYRSRFPQEEN